MANEKRVSRDDVTAIALLVNLNLSDDRRDQLATTLSAYLENLDRLQQLDVGDCEPPAITYESEARS